MANKDTVFILGDEEEDLGGFNDAPEIPTEDDTKPGVDLDPEKAPEDEKKPEESETKEDDPKSDDDQEKDPDKDDPEPEDEKKPEPDEGEQRFNELAAAMTKKDEQINTLVETVNTLTKKATAEPAPEPKAPPEKPQFTQDQWDDDPEGCNEAFYNYRDELKEFNSDLEKEESETIQTKETSDLAVVHQTDYAEEAVELTCLKDNPQVRQVWLNIFNDPQTGFNTRPDGVIRATRELKRQAKEKGIDLTTFGQEAPKEDPPKDDPKPDDNLSPEELKAKGAEDEAARSKRVESGSMQSSSQGSKSKTNLSQAQIETAKKFGITDMDAYAKTLNAMGGKK